MLILFSFTMHRLGYRHFHRFSIYLFAFFFFWYSFFIRGNKIVYVVIFSVYICSFVWLFYLLFIFFSTIFRRIAFDEYACSLDCNSNTLRVRARCIFSVVSIHLLWLVNHNRCVCTFVMRLFWRDLAARKPHINKTI